jgi:iron complex transport system ATP-binding protein
MTKENSILNTVDLSIGYPSKKHQSLISKNLNISLHKGELVCLLGKNGVGKSTLIRTLTKVQAKLGGEIFLYNKPLENVSVNDLAQSISLVLTERIPPSNLSVYELIALGRQPYTNWIGKLTEEDKMQIEIAIEKTNLNSLRNERYDELSDGQLQRVMICRALAQNTDIIILDEPTAHLDIQHKIETFKLLQQLALELDKAILISTHEVQLAILMATHLWLMTDSGIISGNSTSLIENDKINLLFDSNSVIFDKNTKQFKMKPS